MTHSREQKETAWQQAARVIRAELAFYPGRASLMARIVIACTTVMILIMIFRIPGAALGAYYPLLLSWDNPRAMRRSALRTSVVCVLGTAEIVLGAMLSAGSPFVHLLWVAGSLLLVFFLISSMRLYDAALALGLIIATGINTWDLPISADSRLRLTLFTMLSILIGCAVSVLVEYVFAHTHPPDAVLEGVRERLSLVSRLLERLAAGRDDLYQLRVQLSRVATRGTGRLRESLAHANYDTGQKERLATVLSLADRIVDLASHMDGLDARSVAEDRRRCAAIVASIAGVDAHLAREEAPDFVPLPAAAASYTPLLIEIERNVGLLSQSLTDPEHPAHHHLSRPGESRRLPIFGEDAFTNRKHLRFAIRGMLSAFACYLFYMSVGWTGLGASTATCVLTALGNTGASRHKQLLRFAGIIFGACVLGFASQAILLPQIDSLFVFTFLFASVIGLGAWVGTSGPRIAYAGAQIVLAYDLVNLNRFTITTSLLPARDTVLGILLGIIAMWLIFDHLWPTPSARVTRAQFLETLRQIGQLDLSPEALSPAAQSQRLLAHSERLNARLDALRSLTDFSVFEPHSTDVEGVDLSESIKAALPQLRCFLLLKTGLLQHQILSPAAGVNELALRAQRHASSVLLETAQVLESPVKLDPAAGQTTPPAVEAWEAELSNAQPGEQSASAIDLQLSASLLNITRHLRADSLLGAPLP